MEKDASLARAEEELEAVRREAEALRAALAAEQTSHARACAGANLLFITRNDELSCERVSRNFSDFQKQNIILMAILIDFVQVSQCHVSGIWETYC